METMIELTHEQREKEKAQLLETIKATLIDDATDGSLDGVMKVF